MQQNAIEAIKNIMKMLDITPEQLQDNSQSTPEQKKEPILVTEDGVEIYDAGQKVYGVDELWLNHDTSANDANKYNSKEVWFSTAEGRNKYRRENKPLYSLNQIKEAYVNAQGQNTMPDWDTFKNYIQ